MKRWLIITLLLLPVVCEAGSARRFMAARPFCTAAVTGETGDTGNYLSSWSLTGGVCGTLYYHADWGGDGDPRWTITLYSNSGHTQQVGAGNGYGSTITISGSVAGSVTVATGPEGVVSFDGTITR